MVSNPFLYMLAVQDFNFLSNDTQENSTELVPAGEEADLIRLRVGAKELLSSSDVQEILSFFNPADQALEHLSDWRVYIVRLKCIFFIVVNLMIIRGGWTKGSHCTKAVLWIIPIYNLISKCQDNRKDDVHNWIVYYCSCLIDQITFASYNVSSKDGSIASWEIEPLVVYGFVSILCWTRHDPKIKILSNWLTRQKEGWIPFGDQNNIAGIMRQIQQSNINKEDWFQASKEGDKAFLRAAIKSNMLDFNMRTPEGDTALILSCKKGHFGNVQVLLDNTTSKRNLDLNAQNNEGASAISTAASLGHTNILTRLLRCNRLDLDHRRGETAILKAVEEDHFDLGLMIQEKMEEKKISLKNLNLRYLRQCVLLSRKINSGNTRVEAKIKVKNYKDLILQEWVGDKQKASSSVDQSAKSALEELEDLCECPVCFEHMSGKGVVDCSNGHCLCRECARVVRECPMCREDFAERPPMRRRAVEEFTAAAQRLGQELRKKEKSGKMD